MNAQFESYLQYVCAGIRSHRKREEIHDELLGHLEDTYECARATGRTVEEAENDALEHMGDRNLLRHKLAQLYKFSPPEYMRSTVNFLIFGLFFLFFRVEVVPLFGKFMPIIGQVLLLCALFRLYRFNKPFKAAAGIFTAYLLTENIAWFITVYDTPQNVWRGCFAVAAAVFLNLFFCVVYVGMQDICEKYSTRSSWIGFCIIPQLFTAYVSVVFAWDSRPIAAEEYSGLNYTFLLYGLIFPLVSLWRAKQALSYNEPQNPWEQPLKIGKQRLLAVCIVLCLTLPFGSMLAAATRAPQTESYTVSDTDRTAEADEARAHLRTLGLPEEILRDLPDSEVLHYRTAQYMESEKVYASRGEMTELTAYVFYLNGLPKEETPDEHLRDSLYLRVLIAGEDFDKRAVRFRDGIYAIYQDDILFRYQEFSQTDFFLLLAEQNGEMVCAKPFSCWQDAHSGGSMGVTGYDFAFPHKAENRRIYFASTALLNGIEAYNTWCYVHWSMQYYRQVLPSNIVYRCNNERADAVLAGDEYQPWDYEVDGGSIWVSIDVTPEKLTGQIA